MRPTACRGGNNEETTMMLMKLTLPPFLSGRIFPKSHAGIEQKRHRRANRQDAFPPLPGPGSQRAVPQRLDEQWDARHEWVPALPIDGPLDSIARAYPSLRTLIYTSLT